MALGLALAGLSLIVELWSGGGALDGIGVAAALAGAGAYALYVLMADHAVQRRDPISVACYGFLFASLFWSCAQPWWSFPFGVPGKSVSLLGHLSDMHLPVWALMAWMIVLGTIVPFMLIVGSIAANIATYSCSCSGLIVTVATSVMVSALPYRSSDTLDSLVCYSLNARRLARDRVLEGGDRVFRQHCPRSSMSVYSNHKKIMDEALPTATY